MPREPNHSTQQHKVGKQAGRQARKHAARHETASTWIAWQLAITYSIATARAPCCLQGDQTAEKPDGPGFEK